MIEQFLQYIRYEKNYSSHTVLSYQTDLLQLQGYIATQYGSFSPKTLTAEQLREWIIALMDVGEKPSTINRKISAVKSFYKFLNRNGLITSNPTLKIITPKRPKNLPVFFQEKDLDKCLEVSENITTFEGIRNTLIIELVYQTGLRRSEVVNLLDCNVDTVNRQLRVIGKGNKERTIPFGKDLTDRIESYRLARQQNIPGVAADTLFVTKTGERMKPYQIYNIVTKQMAQVSSLSKRSPHVLRHTFATTLLNHGADINSIKSLLGHASLATTELYTHATFEQIINIYQHSHPRGKSKEVFMNIKIQAIKFDATEKLQEFITKKISKLDRLYDQITTAEVFLKVVKPETAENKEAEITLVAPNNKFFASKVCDTFEEAVDLAIDALEKQIEKAKNKR